MLPSMLLRPRKTRFGPFEFDPRRHELSKGGHRIWMPASQLRLLTLFLERPGELVTRDEIAARLWTDARNIDVSTGINTAINRMRGHLQVSPGGPVSIETVIGLGYRFVAEVEQVEVTEGEAGPVAAAAESAEAGALELGALELGVVEQAEAAPVRAEVGAEEPEASVPARSYRPAGYRPWFAIAGLCALALLALLAVYGVRRWMQVRTQGRAASASTDASGGSPPLMRITAEAAGGEVTAAAVAPDGQSVAYSDRSGISVHWFASGQERLLGARPSFTVRRIAWFPDGSQLLMSGTDETTHRRQVWMAPVQGAYLHLIAEDADLAAVSPDGGQIAWTGNEGRELWVAAADGQGPRRLATADAGESFRWVLWAPGGGRLVAAVRRTAVQETAPGDGVYESIDARSGSCWTASRASPRSPATCSTTGGCSFRITVHPTC